MANALAFIGKRLSISPQVVKRFSCTLSGNYVNGNAVGTAGETLAFNSASNAGKRSRPRIPNGGASGALPAAADFEVINSVNGYVAQIEQNAVAPTAQNMVLRIFAAGSGNANPVEIANGTYASYGLAGAVFQIEVTLPAKNN